MYYRYVCREDRGRLSYRVDCQKAYNLIMCHTYVTRGSERVILIIRLK